MRYCLVQYLGMYTNSSHPIIISMADNLNFCTNHKSSCYTAIITFLEYSLMMVSINGIQELSVIRLLLIRSDNVELPAESVDDLGIAANTSPFLILSLAKTPIP